MSHSDDSLLGVVLAGGKSSRMGRAKADLAHPNGGTFLDHAIGVLQPLTKRVVVAGGNHRQAGVTVLPDDVPDLGPAMGVVTAMQYAVDMGAAGLLVLAVDYPLMTSESTKVLISAWQDQPNRCACGFDPKDDFIQPLVAIYPVSVLNDLRQLVNETPHRSLTRWLRLAAPITVEFEAPFLRNVNRPEDWEWLQGHVHPAANGNEA